MIAEQRYSIMLDLTAQAVRPGFVIDVEPKERHDSDVATNRLFDWRFGRSQHYPADA